MSEMLPCPFCGSKAAIEEYDYYDDGPDYSVQCTNIACACSGPYRFWHTKEEAVKAWNHRDACFHCQYDAKPMTEENMRAEGWVRERTCHKVREWEDDPIGFGGYVLVCSQCDCILAQDGEDGPDDGPNFCPHCGAKVVEE